MVNISFHPVDHFGKHNYPDGYNKYIKGVEFSYKPKNDTDGYLSLCIDARLPVSKIYKKFSTKIPVSTAGNALPDSLISDSIFKGKNVVVTHGIKPKALDTNIQPQCGGHQLAMAQKTEEFQEIISNF